ncbi:NAD-dependent epimerase/dehydratase family protein [Krasilnikovia sp. MM14-A1259]|uniref:NAD-dependent epimerase/dehydratase family protein n=1 Tax=Krasilnikovia sp. MM14-A1259 TaxID=3373539 RepID=UPI0037F90173
MRILVLGGTSFVGRGIVAAALDSGADVTLFTRGRTGTDLFPTVPRRVGDRDTGDYTALRDGEWDAVADVSGYLPRHVGPAMDALDGRIGRYLFVSSHAVYVRDGVGPGADENTPRRPPVRDADVLTEDTYGPAKVACEDDVLARYGDRATIVRPVKVAGPHDNQDGLTYWVRRAARGGRVALPTRPEQPVQLVDVRDLGTLVVRLLADGRAGAYNAAGPVTTIGDLIGVCAAAAGTRVEVVPVAPEPAPKPFPLVKAEAMWHSQHRGASRARAAGMPVTPLAETVADTLAWDRARGTPPLRRGFTDDQERQALATAS